MEPRLDRYDVDRWRLGIEAMYRLRRRDVCAVEAGLTDAEFARVETEFGY
jgi:hypothetical protein